ncbi:MAG: SpoIIIAH-like family protein [Clostridiales bacterium]|nr:SpoIIIAH-like family protein [Clostridiales bacterium]
MLKKKTKVFILVAMVLLLGVTGYLNIALNNRVTQTSTSTVTTANYFSTYREDRQSTRDQELLYYDAIITSESSSDEAVKNAEAKKLAIVAQMETELVIEGLIKAKGFEDCIVTNVDPNVKVVVKCVDATLTSSEVAQIVSIVKEQTAVDIDNIQITPVE